LWQYETALREECGYRGANPYWDWTLDQPEYNSSFEKSPIFDPRYFGGNGENGSEPLPPLGPVDIHARVLGSCFKDGPLAHVKPIFGPGWSMNVSTPHCVKRNLNTSLATASLGWTANVVPLLKETDYAEFIVKFDIPKTKTGAGIHRGGHFSVGGEVG
jgi:tyrosinase